MVTAGGLSESSGLWVSQVNYLHSEILQCWKEAVIELLWTALESNQLQSDLPKQSLENLLTQQEKRFWRVKIQSFSTKEHFLRYAGRYVRRPPIAQKRITNITERTVTFWAKDKKLRRRVLITCSLEDFIDRWSQHIPERYCHAVRSFGLFSPRTLNLTSEAVLRSLGQPRRKRPSPRRWADSIRRDFGRDPLIDPQGQKMKSVGRITPHPANPMRTCP